MGNKMNIGILAGLMLATVLLYVSYRLGGSWEFALKLRLTKVMAMLVVACCVAFSSIAFQTITGNRILTPSIMGFESVYLLLQTLLVFVYGDRTFHVLSSLDNYLLSIGCMILFAFLLYLLIYKKGRDNMYLLLLIGLVLGILFNTLSSFMQLLIDPNDFFIVQGKMFASFNKINEGLLWYSAGILAVVLAVGMALTRYLDVIALGRDQAISLGLNYNRMIRVFLVLIAIMVSVSTALAGPVTFLGLLVSNLTYELVRTYRHRMIITACCLVSVITIVGGQLLMEQVFNLSTPISTIINFIGGLYFLYLMLRIKKL